MFEVAVGWELYERTHLAIALGLVGLVQVIPIALLALPAGELADRRDRRSISVATLGVLVACSLALAAISFTQAPVPLIYTVLFVIGVALAFYRPATAALLPQLVPIEQFATAVTWSSTAWQLSSVVGPALGGALIAYAHRAGPVYVVDAVLMSVFIGMLLRIEGRQAPPAPRERSARNLLAGLGFVWRDKVMLGAITLDLFAVLFGGATALLPLYAKDILHVGPAGFGWLRGAPAIGAVAMAFTLTHRRPLQNAGRTLLWAVAGFGIATIVFGFSRSYPLSLSMMIVAGGLDMISVVIRHSLVQVRTPDHMRGRVSAINGVFIDTSNELGAFESGATAQLFGPVASVAGGGAATLLVVAVIARIWPALWRLGTLTEPPLQLSEEIST